MKLLRVGELGSEIVAALDGNNVIRDLSDHIKDLNPQTINKGALDKLNRIKLLFYLIVFYLNFISYIYFTIWVKNYSLISNLAS